LKTYDDGIAKIYQTKNTAKPGEMPAGELEYKTKFCFSFYELGIARFYHAMQNGQNISAVIETYFEKNIFVNDIAVFEDGSQFHIRMVQPVVNEEGLRVMRISLERTEHSFEIPKDN
jgi:hypothetical protein